MARRRIALDQLDYRQPAPKPEPEQTEQRPLSKRLAAEREEAARELHARIDAAAKPLAEKRAAEQTAREQAQAKALADRQAALAARREQSAKVAARGRYLAAGGTPERFERDWPAIHAQQLADAAAGDVG